MTNKAKSKPELAPEDKTAATADDDAFFASIRLDQSLADNMLGVKRALHIVPVKKPTKTDFFRVHAEHFFDTYLVELKDEGENYFATPQVAQFLSEFVRPARLRYCVTRQGTPFVWPLKLPRDERRRDSWARSAMEAAHEAETKWVRISANKQWGIYECFEALGKFGDPQWLDEPWTTVLRTALRDSIIDNEDHPVVRQLLGHS